MIYTILTAHRSAIKNLYSHKGSGAGIGNCFGDGQGNGLKWGPKEIGSQLPKYKQLILISL